MKITKKISYADYMFYHVGIPGILGFIAEILMLTNTQALNIIGATLLTGSVILLISGKTRNTDRPDELTKEVLHTCNLYALLVILFLIIVILIGEFTTNVAKIAVHTNMYSLLSSICMALAFSYAATVGISYRYVEAR